MFDAIAQQYLASLKNNGSGVAEQPNANWQKANSTTNPELNAEIYNLMGGAGRKLIDLSKLGYSGPAVGMNAAQRDSGGDYIIPASRFNVPTEWDQFVKDNGLGLMTGHNDQNFNLSQLTQNGRPIAGASYSESEPNQDAFNAVRALTNTALVGGAGYAAMGGAGGGGIGAEGLSGMDLAADAAIGTGNNIGTAGAAFGNGAAGGGVAGGGGGFGPGSFDFSPAGAGGGGAAGAAGGGGGGSPGFLNSLASGDWGGAASAAGNWATSPGGLQTLGGLGSSLLQSNANRNALNSQTNATNSANALQKYFYDQNRADNMPLLDTRNQALGGLNKLISNPNSITSDPGYQFGLSQGVQGVDRSAASKGGLYSGATLKALSRYGTDYGQTKLSDSFGRLSGAAGLGNIATSSNTAAGANYANQAGNNLTSLGNAQGASAINTGNIWGNALNGAISAYNRQGG